VTSVAAARHQWDEGKRRLAGEGGDVSRSRHLDVLVQAVVEELQRRVGQTFTLGDLARAYGGAEDWVREVILATVPANAKAGVRDTALVQDAAFARYAQGASDYRP
jgi:hypothetical protein